MVLRNLLVIPALLCLAGVALGQQEAIPGAHANIFNADGVQIGTVIFTPSGTGVKMLFNLNLLPPGPHGIHIHAVGKCDGPAFTTAGGHLNPDMKMHGKDNPQGPHAGDLLNINVDPNGGLRTTLVADHVTLGNGPNSLFHPGGTALVIHAMADDYKTDPAGNSGARIACGVIEKN